MAAFDTLKLARRLEAAGLSREQANGAAEALADTFAGEVATRSDSAELRSATQSDIAELRSVTKSEIAALRSATQGDIAGLKGELTETRAALDTRMAKLEGDFRSEIATVRGEVAGLRSFTAQWIITAVFVNILAVIGAVAAVWQIAHTERGAAGAAYFSCRGAAISISRPQRPIEKRCA